jgi:hypothetical protein
MGQDGGFNMAGERPCRRIFSKGDIARMHKVPLHRIESLIRARQIPHQYTLSNMVAYDEDVARAIGAMLKLPARPPRVKHGDRQSGEWFRQLERILQDMISGPDASDYSKVNARHMMVPVRVLRTYGDEAVFFLAGTTAYVSAHGLDYYTNKGVLERVERSRDE